MIQGTVVEGMQVVAQASPNMTVQVNPGTCLVPTGTYPTSYAYHCFIDTTGGETVTIGTASGSNPRIDYIVAYVDKSVTPSSGTPNNLNNMLKLADVQGIPAGSPVVPSVGQIQTAIGASNPYIILAQVYVATSVTTITNANITDLRQMATTSSSSNGWQNLSGVLSYSANNGNREFVLNTSVNLTGTIQPGSRIQVTRSTAPPTQCMSYSGSTQYANNTSPTGITFTGNYTEEGWIFVTGYPSAQTAFLGRDSTGGTASGWEFGLTTAGQLTMYWRNATGTSSFTTTQSVPLNQWVHVAGVATVATPSVAFYINGVAVSSTSSSTAATTVVQPTANLTVGNRNSATGYFQGYISELRLWSAAQTQTQIQNNMSISVIGTETNLIGAWEGNGNFSDLTTNGNVLTAQGGAVATQAANPYNAVEYGIVTKATSSQITVFTAVGYGMPNQTLTNPQFSYDRAPYGFPAGKDAWTIYWLVGVDFVYGIAAFNTWYEPLTGITVNTGSWDLFANGVGNPQGSSSGALEGDWALSTSNSTAPANAQSVGALLKWHGNTGGGSTTALYITMAGSIPLNVTAQTPIYWWTNVQSGGGSITSHLRGDINFVSLRAVCALL